MNDIDRQKLLSTAFLDLETMVGGHVMRPMNFASYDVLMRTNNPLVKGDPIADFTPEFSAAVMGFIYTHCAPWPEVVRASLDEKEFRVCSMIFCGDLTPDDYQIAFKRLEQQCKMLEASQVEIVEEIGGKKPLPATNPAS
jgi:hypothetical protein